jgi:hypothetical protein
MRPPVRPPVIQPLTIKEIIERINYWKSLENLPHSVTDNSVNGNSR